MNELDYRCIGGAIIGGVFVIGACIMFSGAIVADAVLRSSETNTGGGSLGMSAFLVAILFFVLGVGGLYKTSKDLKK